MGHLHQMDFSYQPISYYLFTVFLVQYNHQHFFSQRTKNPSKEDYSLTVPKMQFCKLILFESFTCIFIFHASSSISRFLDVTTRIKIWNRRIKIDTRLRNILIDWRKRAPLSSLYLMLLGSCVYFMSNTLPMNGLYVKEHQGSKHKQQYLRIRSEPRHDQRDVRLSWGPGWEPRWPGAQEVPRCPWGRGHHLQLVSDGRVWSPLSLWSGPGHCEAPVWSLIRTLHIQKHECLRGKQDGVHLQGSGCRRAWVWENQHHQEICPPILFGALQSHHRRWLCSKGITKCLYPKLINVLNVQPNNTTSKGHQLQRGHDSEAAAVGHRGSGEVWEHDPSILPVTTSSPRSHPVIADIL